MSKDLYVVAEQRDGEIAKVTLELLGEATKLAADLGEKVVGVLMGDGIKGKAQEMIEERVKDIAKAHEQMYGIDVTVDFQPSSHGALINDPEIVENVMEKAGEVFDPSEFTHVPAMMLGEDFANYLEEIDGCFAFIGGGDHPANHHGKFDFDEKALISGVRLMLTFVIV